MGSKKYCISENQSDLDLLSCVETNLIIDAKEYAERAMDAANPAIPDRSINPEDYEIEVLELHQDNKTIRITKYDVIALAKHLGLIEN